MSRRALAALTGAALLGAAPAARGQPGPFAPPPGIGGRASAGSSEPRGSLKGRLALEVAARLASSERAADRQRALERLGADGSPRALTLLVEALEPGGAARTAEDRLVAVRALAPHARHDVVRRALVRLTSGAGGTGPSAGPLEALTRRSAALALARSGTSAALAALGQAVRLEGPSAEAAADAILAHPPRTLAPLLAARGLPSPTLARLLGELGDQRAFEALRGMVRRGSPEVRAAAALALTRLGDYETVALAERWAEGPGPAALRVAGARILSLARAPGASTAIAALIGDPATASDGLALAEAASEPALLPVLERELARAPREQVPALLAALGRTGGERAAAVLERELARADRAPFAAYALALCPGEAAARALARALARPASRRLAARAAEVRALVLGEQVAGFREALAPPPASDAVADTLPTRALLAGVEEDELRAPIYAYALAVRDDATVRERVSELLASGDVMVRRATALGLAASARPDATGLLEDAYRFETDPLVRRALVTSLGSRGAGQRTLALAAALDGEAAVREAARRALGPRVAPPLDGRGVAWLVVEGPPRAVAGRRALVFPASGPPRAARADSDGLLVVTGLPPGPFEVRLAPRDDREHAPARSR